MANIEKKQRDELSDNSNRMISSIDAGLDGSPLPLETHHIDPSVTDIAEAVKFVIDTGWLGEGNFYAFKMEFKNREHEFEKGVVFTDNAEEFLKYVKIGFYRLIDDFPLIIGVPRCTKDNTKGYIKYLRDGDVFIKQNDGTLLTLDEWKQIIKLKRKK